MIDLIFDRTQSDIDRLEVLKSRVVVNGWDSLTNAEKTEYVGSKGSYKASDMVRVSNAVLMLQKLLTTAGYSTSDISFPTYTDGETLYLEDMEYYLEQVSILVTKCATIITMHELPSDIYNYANANRVESILMDIYTMLEYLNSTRYYKVSGNYICGQSSRTWMASKDNFSVPDDWFPEPEIEFE